MQNIPFIQVREMGGNGAGQCGVRCGFRRMIVSCVVMCSITYSTQDHVDSKGKGLNVYQYSKNIPVFIDSESAVSADESAVETDS